MRITPRAHVLKGGVVGEMKFMQCIVSVSSHIVTLDVMAALSQFVFYIVDLLEITKHICRSWIQCSRISFIVRKNESLFGEIEHHGPLVNHVRLLQPSCLGSV